MTAEQIDQTLQRGLVAVYLLGTLAGLAILLTTPPSLQETIGRAWANVLGVFMLLGGGSCFVGTLVPRGRVGDWFGEYVGLWAFIASVGLYGVIAAMTLRGVPGRGAGCLLLLSFVCLLVVRWFRVRDDAREDSGRKEHSPPTHARDR